MRCFFYISYRGTAYHGWQLQPNAHTVQAEVNRALEVVLRQPVESVASGRTDAGVHAKEQVFHADIPDETDLSLLTNQLNGVLPADIVVNNILLVKSQAHARFDALARTYQYHIRLVRTPFCQGEYYYLPYRPDFVMMNRACQLLLGEHDFASFSRVKTDVSHFRCTIQAAGWQYDEQQAVFTVTANRFLRGMVRALTGTLLEVGRGRLDVQGFGAILAARNRQQAGVSVPPEGLYLCRITYPQDIFI